MTIQVNAPFSVNDKLQALINDRVTKLATFYERITSADVFLKAEENRSNGAPQGSTVEIRLDVPGQLLHASASAESYEKALADAAEKMRRQLLKYKDQVTA
ncbi:MAG TPA: ribosome-associated translation inhibitor RaiA [Saprospiraceae bacterium]|nr:ribosome-associated translation inhibitor RaiA [Saprospiraceae bacterium]HMP14937.1 ribosome-associated translation inhibitor RaiA [Saprospiraceae bacterium]